MNHDTQELPVQGRYAATIYPGLVEYVEVDDTTVGVESGWRLSQLYVQFLTRDTDFTRYGFKVSGEGKRSGRLHHGEYDLEWQVLQGDDKEFIVVSMQPQMLGEEVARALIQLAIDNTSY